MNMYRRPNHAVSSFRLIAALSLCVTQLCASEAGDAGDDRSSTHSFSPENARTQLYKGDGVTPILPHETPALYGTEDGMTIYDDGIDVCSWNYVRHRGLSKPICPVYMDLSDDTNWLTAHVAPDTVAIDPSTGRFKFSEGDWPDYVKNVESFSRDGINVLIWNNPVSAALAGIKVVRNSDHYPTDATDGLQVYDGLNNGFIDEGLINGTTYYYRVFAYDKSNKYTAAIQTSQDNAVPREGLMPNLVRNPSFEEGCQPNGVGNGWYGWRIDETSATFRVTDTVSHDGQYSQEIYLVPEGGRYGAHIEQPFQLKDNTTYLLSFWVMSDGATSVLARVYGARWEFLYEYSVACNNRFRERMIRFTTPENNGVPISSYVMISHQQQKGTSLFIDKVGLYELKQGTHREESLMKLISQTWTGFGVPGHGIVKVDGNYAYIPPGEGDFQVIDIEDKRKPRVIGHFDVEFSASLDVYSNYVYLCRAGGLITLDISDRSNPQWPNGIMQHPNRNNLPWLPSAGGKSYEILIRNGYGFASVSGSSTGLYILDISVPTNVREISSVDIGDLSGGTRVFVSENKAYVGLGAGGAVIVDVANVHNPTLVGRYNELDPSDPYSTPYLIGISGNKLLMSTRWRANVRPADLRIIDCSDPANPRKRGCFSLDDGGSNPRAYLISADSYGDYVYVADAVEDCTQCSMNRYSMPRTRLLTFDVSDPDFPLLVDEYVQNEPAKYRLVGRYDQFLYVNDYNYGVRVFSLENPRSPAQIGGTLTAGEGHYAWVNDDASYAYLSQTFGGSIHIIDIANPLNPVKKGTYWDGEWNEESPFVGRGNYLYVPARGSYDVPGAVKIIDVSNPEAPNKVGEFPTIRTALQPSIALFDHYAYVVTLTFRFNIASEHQKTLNVYDISDPSSPVLASSLVLPGWPDLYGRPQIFADGEYAYLVFGEDSTLMIVDVRNPSQPTVVGVLRDNEHLSFQRTREAGGRLWVSQGYAYISAGNTNGIYIVDVKDVASPAYVDTLPVPGWAVLDLRVSGRYLYVGAYANIYVYDLTTPANPVFVSDAFREGLGWWMAGWSSGRLFGEFLYSPSLSHLNIIDVLRDDQSPRGIVTAKWNAGAIDKTAPVAVAGADRTCDEGGGIVFDARASYDPAPSSGIDWNSCAWNFGDLHDPTSIVGVTATHIYREDGEYTATLKLSDLAGNTSTGTARIVVKNVAPKVQAGDTQTINEGDTVLFAGSFTDPGSRDTHTIDWDFGDNTTTSGALTVAHRYGDSGTYTVTLSVTDDDQGVSTDTLTVQVSNVSPAVVGIANDSPKNEGSPVRFSAAFTDPGWLDTHTAAWDFGDAGAGIGPTQGTVSVQSSATSVTGVITISHIYGDNGTYAVTLTLSDDDGGVATNTTVVTVNNVAPTVDVGFNQTVDENAPVAFTANITDPGWLDNYKLTWSLGDNSITSLLATVSNVIFAHAYEWPGVYEVSVSAEDDDGGQSSPASRTIGVRDAAAPNVALVSPASEAIGLCQVLNGIVPVLGLANDIHPEGTHPAAPTPDNFAWYEVEYASGKNATNGWRTLTHRVVTTSVTNVAILAVWDTTQMFGGYYTLRITASETEKSDGTSKPNVSYATATVFVGEPEILFSFGEKELNKPGYICLAQAPENDGVDTLFVPDGQGGFYTVQLDDRQSLLFVTDRNNNRVAVYLSDGTEDGTVSAFDISTLSKEMIRGRGSKQDKPAGIDVDLIALPQTENAYWVTLYVADRNTDRLLKIAPTGVVEWGSDAGLNKPAGLVRDYSGRTFVADENNDRLVVLDLDGSRISEIRSGFNGPTGVDIVSLVDAAGVMSDVDIYVTDRNNDRLVRLNGDGRFIEAIGSSGKERGKFNKPEGVCITETGYVYVTDTNNDRVQKFDAYGNCIMLSGPRPEGPSLFNKPVGIALGRDGKLLYVVDQNNNRVLVFGLPER